MAIPKSYYFQHDYHASNDAKVLFLRQQLGMEGYGIYWFIIEQLAQAGGKLPLKIVPVLAMQSQTQETKVRAVIEGYELFQIIDSHFFSVRLNTHLDVRKELSESGKNGAAIRWANRVAIGDGNSNPNAKEIKERKEIKEIGSEKISQIANEVWKDQKWKESICSGLTISMEELKKWLSLFNSSIATNEDSSFDKKSYMRMSRGWISTQQAKGVKVETGVSRKSDSAPLSKLSHGI